MNVETLTALDAELTHLWWNGAEEASAECAYLSAGKLPDGRWIVHHGGNATAYVFDHGEDAIGVARHITIGWIRVPTSFAARGTEPVLR